MDTPKVKRLWICSSCGASLSSSYNLKVHIESKCSTVKNFICEICQNSFKSNHSLKTHKLTVHSEEKKFVCSHCAKSFASKGQLVVHERSHTKAKPFVCSECGKSFAYRESLVTHSTTHSNIKPYACQNCQKTFSCIGNLIKHRKIRPDTCGREEFQIQKIAKRAGVKLEKKKNAASDTANENEIVYQEILTYNDNNEIGESYAIILPNEPIESVQTEAENDEFQELIKILPPIVQENEGINENHESEIEYEEVAKEESENVIETQIQEDQEMSEYLDFNTNDQKYYCKLCPKIYQKKNISVKHLKKEHQITLKSFIYDDANRYRKPQKIQKFFCKFCPRRFTSEKMMLRHQIVHGEKGNLIHKCDCCSLWFESENELENHQNLEHEDSLKCSECSKKFDRREKLLSHKKYAHSGRNAVTKKYVFVCSLCGRNFNTKVALSDHERAKCGSDPIYSCSYCGKKYHSAGSLKGHITIHTLEFNFSCDHCPKKFRTKGQLVVHQRTHTNDKPFKCNFPECNASFAHRESLLTHHTTHTGIKRFQCEHCCAQFSCISNLLAHRRSRKQQKSCSDSTKIHKVENALTTLSSIDSYMDKE